MILPREMQLIVMWLKWLKVVYEKYKKENVLLPTTLTPEFVRVHHQGMSEGIIIGYEQSYLNANSLDEHQKGVLESALKAIDQCTDDEKLIELVTTTFKHFDDIL